MKKFLLLACSVFAAWQSQAQVIVTSDDFEAAGAGLPTGWTQTTLATDGGWKHGTATALSSTYFTMPAHTSVLATNQDACNCDKSNDFLKSPVFDLTGQSVVAVSFDLFYGHGTYTTFTESLKLEVSTNSGATWTVLHTFTGAAGWSTQILDLSSVGNMDSVMVGFRYNSGGGWTFGAGLDNFKVYIPLNQDLSVTSVVLPSFVANNGSVPVTGSLINYGGVTVTSMDLNYNIDNGATVTSSLTGLSIAPINGTYNYTHGTNWTATPVGTHVVKVWATNINGNVDQNLTNDSHSNSTIVASQTVTRMPVIEEFSSSTCVPCAAFNTTFDPLLATNNTNLSNGEVNCIRYQMNWPAPGDDPSYNADGVTRQTYYAVNAIPSPWIDGHGMTTSDQAELDANKAIPSPALMSATYSIGGNVISTTVNVTPYITIPTGTKLFIGVAEKQYNFTTNPTTQHEFDHIMRKMLPDGNGITLALSDGVQQSFTKTYTFNPVVAGVLPTQNSYNLWVGMNNLEVIAFIQNTSTKEIYQSTTATMVTGVNDIKTDFSVDLYPNPVKNNMVISLNTPKSATVNVALYNTLGQIVYVENTTASSGTNNLHIDTSKLMEGMYFAKVSVGDQIRTVKFSIEK